MSSKECRSAQALAVPELGDQASSGGQDSLLLGRRLDEDVLEGTFGRGAGILGHRLDLARR